MDNKLKTALSIVALSPMAAIASPLAFPAPHMWHFTVGADTGVENYRVHYQFSDSTTAEKQDIYDGSNYTLGLNQSVGYGRWFYVQAKESASTSLAELSYSDDTSGQAQRARVSFFDFDIRAYFPLQLSQKSKISLQPQVGFASHFTHVKARGNSAATIDDTYTRYRARALAPLVGLALGCDVSSCFNFRFGIAFEIENFKHRYQSSPITAPENWSRLKQRRCGVHSTLDLNYKIGQRLDLTGTVDHLNYNPSGDVESNPNDVDHSYLNRFSYKMGVRWNF